MDKHNPLQDLARRIGCLRRLVRDTRAAAPIEFAMVGCIFLLLVCMTLELGLVLFTQSVMDNALRDAARLILNPRATSLNDG